MRFSVCIESVFRGWDPLKALEGVREAGFGAFEFWGWWDKDLGALADKAAALSLDCAALCTRFVPLTVPERRGEYLAGLEESVGAAKRLGAGLLISQAGADTGAERLEQRRSIVEGLKAAVPLLEKNGLTLALEPLNTRIDHPGYFLERSGEGFDIIGEVGRATGSRRVKLLFDIYHQQITEGDLIRRFSPEIGRIGHFHAAGNPGRGELDTGELDYRGITAAIRALAYEGFLGLEYFPGGLREKGGSGEGADPLGGLKRLRAYLGA
jgi:hydroxypyruvate isomerase